MTGRLAGRAATAFVAAFAAVAPLLWWRSWPLPAFHQEAAAFALGLAVIAAAALQPRWRAGGIPVVALLPGLLAAVTLGQTFAGLPAYPHQGLIACLYLLWAAALVQAGGVLRDALGADRLVAALATGLAAGAVLNALAGITQYLGLAPQLAPFVVDAGAGRVSGNLGQPNLYANQLALGIVSVLWLRAAGRAGVVLAWLMLAPSIVALALCGSRSAWFFLLWAAVAAAILARVAPSPAHVTLLRTTVRVIAGFVLAQVVLSLLPGDAHTALARIARSPQGIAERIEIGRDAIALASGAPFLGVGIGQFDFARLAVLDTATGFLATGRYVHAHNLPLHLAAEYGVVATAAVVCLGCAWALRCARAGRGLRDWWLFVVVGVVGLHSLVEYPLWYAHVLGVVALVAGAFDPRRTRPLSALARPAVLVACALGVATLFGSASAYRGVERLFADAGGAARPTVLVAEAAGVETHSLFLPWVELAYTSLIRLEPEGLGDALAHNGRVLRFAPDDHVLHRHALLLALAGEAAEAAKTWRLARALHPGFAESLAPLLDDLAAREPRVAELLGDAAR